MNVSYRATTSLVVIVYVIATLDSVLFPMATPPMAVSDNSVTFDLCGARWVVQRSAIERLAALASGASLVFVFIQGLRNRSTPRWVPIVALGSVGVMLGYESVQIRNCGPCGASQRLEQ